MKPVDFHVHFYPEKIAPRVVDGLKAHYGIPVNHRATREEYLDLAAAAGLAGAVFFTAATRPDQVRAANDWALANAGPGLVGFGTLHPYDEGTEAEIARLRAAGIKGVKFHPDFQRFYLDEDRALALYERLARDFLVVLHVGDDETPAKTNYTSPERLARVLDILPGLRVVAAHMGGYQMWERSLACLAGRPVWFDTSSTLDFIDDDFFRRLIDVHGPHRILLGSDYPFREPGWEIARLRRLSLPAETFEAVIGGNARRLLADLGL
ncbi:MAG: amidohydrolase family protein [Thermoanaerobacterales bacterium]|nr:amidohydrolase family protein [Thermoanaerobacterales bacterium]